MFETSQQEPSPGTGKTIFGVIAVVVVALVVLYFLFLRQEPAATPAAGAGAATPAAGGEAPDPIRDLRVLRSNLGRDQTQTMAIWDIQLANRSRSHAYKNIQYATDYWNADGAVLYHNEGTLSEQIGPGDQQTISKNDGLYPVGTVRYAIEIKGAEAVQP